MTDLLVEPAHVLAETNLPGVFSKSIRTPGLAGPGALFHSSVLDQINRMTSPGAQMFRDRILSRAWKAEDQIVPVMKTLTGVTHPLSPPVHDANARLTGQRWAGGSIKGTWNVALGIWRVPSAYRPSTPQSVGGGWKSSSWVGIDGTYGTNDVLQAGVHQDVQADGSPSYYPWYEWYVAAGPPGLPSYIYEQLVVNMLVQPGDEMFCGVYYVGGRQGEILLANVDRGKYFSIVLAAPSTASFSGNSIEWIMEAPNSGEPGTALSGFTPVVFSAALGSGPNNASGDPANGDSNDIVLNGTAITKTALRIDRVEIDYTGSGWFQLHPETVFDHATQKIAAVARTPDNLDLFVIGFDNAVWSTFWSAGGGWRPEGWFQLHPETVFDHATQKIAAVARTPDNLDLFVIGFDNAVWSTFWSAGGGWRPEGWFQLHPETVFDHATQKIAAVARTPDNLDLFVIGFDNAVWSTFWSAGGGWRPEGWFQLHPETVFDHATQKIAAVARTPDNLDLFVIGFDNAVWSTFWSAGGGWRPEGWFQLHPETVFDHATQKIAAVARTPDNLDLFVIGFDNAVWSTFWSAGGGWRPEGWFQLHPETVFDHTKQQMTVVSRSPNNLDLFVIGFDNAVWSTFWSAGGGWRPEGWFQLHPETVFDHTKQQMTVVSRSPNNLDLFVIGFDNAVWTDFWAADFGGWA